MNNRKQKLINEVTKKFGHIKDFTTDLTVYCESFGDSLHYFPEENLEKMLTVEPKDTFKELYDAFGKCGALHFTPYIEDTDAKLPILCIKWNRHMHMSSSQYFQVSSTPNGRGDNGHSSYPMYYFTINNAWSDNVLRNSVVSSMIWWASIIDASYHYEGVRELLKDNVQVLEDFLNRTRAVYYLEPITPWAEICKYISTGEGKIDAEPRTLYSLLAKGLPIAYLALGKKTIQVETARSELFTLNIPALQEGTDYDLTDEDTQYQYESECDVMESAHYIEILATMVLNLCNIHANFTGWYATSKKALEPMRRVNLPMIKEFESLNTVYNAEPDMF